MGGTPSQYNDLHILAHSWLLTGTATTSASADIFPETDLGVLDYLSAALTSSPYSVDPYDPSAESSVDPDSPVGRLKAAEAAIAGDITSNAPHTLLDTYYPAAADAIDAEFDYTYIDGVVDAFEVKQKTKLAGDIARFMGVMAGLNGLDGSATALGLAMLSRDHERGVAEFEANLRSDLAKTRAQAMMAAVGTMFEHQRSNIAARISAGGLVTETAKLEIAAMRTYSEDILRLQMEDTLWELNLFDFGNKGLGAISGASIIPHNPSPIMEAISVGASAMSGLVPLVTALL